MSLVGASIWAADTEPTTARAATLTADGAGIATSLSSTQTQGRTCQSWSNSVPDHLSEEASQRVTELLSALAEGSPLTDDWDAGLYLSSSPHDRLQLHMTLDMSRHGWGSRHSARLSRALSPYWGWEYTLSHSQDFLGGLQSPWPPTSLARADGGAGGLPLETESTCKHRKLDWVHHL